MKILHNLACGITCTLLCSATLPAAEPTPETAGLQKAAADFVTAYNNRDAAAIARLFMENGEMTDLSGTSLTTGREDIQARYEMIFAEKALRIAIEVRAVRLITPDLAIEDGIYHLTPADDASAPPQSTTYTATLMRDENGGWHIASTRSLRDVTEPAGHLAGLAALLRGEWTYQGPDGIRLDLAFGWDSSGTLIAGEMLTTSADAEPQQGNIRIAWDASGQQIVSWMFDAKGGFSRGVWTPDGDAWLIRSEGTTGDGECTSASQQLLSDGMDTLVWKATHRVVDGQSTPDTTIRLVRRAPEPAAD
jgi:uncharacterized protein (TIGR02246 family)